MLVDRRTLRRRLFALAAEQGGYFTAAQAKTLGYSYQAQAYHVHVGNWLRVDRGVFRLAEWVPTTHDYLARWALWSGGRGVVSHETALSVHGAGEFESALVNLTVPPEFRRKNDAVALHYTDLPESDISEGAGFRVTTLTRSLIDVAASATDEDQLARAVQDALARGLVSTRRLRARAEAIDMRAALYLERASNRLDAP